jgi:hypothetical protein
VPHVYEYKTKKIALQSHLPIQPVKKSAFEKSGSKKAGKKNKLGLENSLVNNINAKKKEHTSRSKKNLTVSKQSCKKIEDNWGNGK